MRISPVSSTWYKVTTSVVVSQLKVLNCCCLLKVFGIRVQTLIKATTFWTKRNPKKFFSDFPSELEEKARHVPGPWKNIGAPCFLALHCPHHLALEQVCDYVKCLKENISSSCQENGTHAISPFAKLQDPQLLGSLLLSSASRTSSWLPSCGNHV